VTVPRREQLPDHLLALIRPHLGAYTSDACRTTRLLAEASADRPDHAAELRQWRRRLHQQCPRTHPHTRQPCDCWCHTTEETP
jgi:hypothetical protein